jgi:LysM repeat protein
MKTRGSVLRTLAVSAILATLVLPASFAAEEVEGGRIKGYVPPPKELKKLGEGHWTPYDPPPPPEGEKVHVVKPGDTLWDLAQTYYSDNYLWPVIWDANRWVTYSHWIYPGDPLVIPPHPTIVPPEPPAPPEPEPVAQVPEPPEPVPEPALPPGPLLVPVADRSELYCSGSVVPSYEGSATQIAGFEEEVRSIVGTGEVVYINAGLADGVDPGAEYTVVRPTGDVSHPESGDDYGVAVRWLGRLRVLAVQEETATAEVVFACAAVKIGDDLVPYAEIPVPIAELSGVDRWSQPEDPLGTTGYVLHANEEISVVAQGHVISVDVGDARGARPGDQLMFYRDRSGMPRTILGAGVVLRTTPIASTVKITQSFREIVIGDRVEMR